MFGSRNTNTHPMKGFVEYESRRDTARSERVKLIVRALSDRFTGEAFPAMSDHYRPSGIPGEIGNVVVHQVVQPELPFDQ